MIVQTAIATGRRHEAEIRLCRHRHRRSGQPSGRQTVSCRPPGNVLQPSLAVHIRRDAAQNPDLPGGLVPGRRIDIHGWLDEVRRLQVRHFPSPDIEIDERAHLRQESPPGRRTADPSPTVPPCRTALRSLHRAPAQSRGSRRRIHPRTSGPGPTVSSPPRDVNLESLRCLGRHAAAAHHIDGLRTPTAILKIHILIPIGIQVHSSLLSQHTLVMLSRG
jgi:hypothetical protein